MAFFYLKLIILDVWDMPNALWLIGLLLDHFDPQKNWSIETMGRYTGFLSLEVNIRSIQSVLFSWYAILLEHQ